MIACLVDELISQTDPALASERSKQSTVTDLGSETYDRSRAEHEIGTAAPCHGHKPPSSFPPRIQELFFLRIVEAAVMQAFD